MGGLRARERRAVFGQVDDVSREARRSGSRNETGLGRLRSPLSFRLCHVFIRRCEIYHRGCVPGRSGQNRAAVIQPVTDEPSVRGREVQPKARLEASIARGTRLRSVEERWTRGLAAEIREGPRVPVALLHLRMCSLELWRSTMPPAESVVFPFHALFWECKGGR